MKVKDIVSIITAPTEIIRYGEDGEPENVYSVYSPSDVDSMLKDIANMDVESIDHGREAIIITV